MNKFEVAVLDLYDNEIFSIIGTVYEESTLSTSTEYDINGRFNIDTRENKTSYIESYESDAVNKLKQKLHSYMIFGEREKLSTFECVKFNENNEAILYERSTIIPRNGDFEITFGGKETFGSVKIVEQGVRFVAD